jgi:cysteine desulfurase
MGSGFRGDRSASLYLDYNATTPVDARVVREALPYLTAHFGNPSSAHEYGRAPRHAVVRARERLAALLCCEPDEIVFTGGGSEADNLAVRGTALALATSGGGHVITQRTEHPAVLEACHALERHHGSRVTYLPVDPRGLVSPADLRAAIEPGTALVSIMHANNETGSLQPIAELAAIAGAAGVRFHTDAAQSVGKVPVRVGELGVDLLTVAGHKLYAPKGVGALYVRRGVRLEPLVYGGGQERGLRAGTESVAGIVALGAAAALAAEHLDAEGDRVRRLRDRLHGRLEELLPGRVRLHGHPTERLPNTLNVGIDGVVGDRLLAAAPRVAASTGSACHEDRTDPSPVLLAMGVPSREALSAVRLTLGRWSSEAEVDEAACLLAHAANARARGLAGS